MRIPVVLPTVHVTVDPDGSLSVEVDGEPYETGRRLIRKDLHGVLTAITTDRATPVRVEVREADGTNYDDIATPSEPVPRLEPADSGGSPGQPPLQPIGSAGLCGRGFQPGEPVALAYLLTQLPADPDGTATLRIPPALLATHREGLVLLGLTSRALVEIAAPA